MEALALANEVAPYVTAAVAAYGTSVATRTTDSVADATVSFGRRVLQRLLGRGDGDPALEAAVNDLADAPGDADFQAVLRARIKRALLDDAELRTELASLLASAGPTLSASGDRSVAVQHNTGVISTGDGTSIQR